MKHRKSLKEDTHAYKNIILGDLTFIVTIIIVAFIFSPWALFFTLPFVYDLYYVYHYKKRTIISMIVEIGYLIP